MAVPYYRDAEPADYSWMDDIPEPEDPEENVVCTCDNCEEDIYDCDDMAVIEDRTYHIGDSRPHVLHICMACWEENKWDKAEELLDMIGVWYWTGDAVDAMKIAGDHILKEQNRQRTVIGNIVSAAVSARKGNA